MKPFTEDQYARLEQLWESGASINEVKTLIDAFAHEPTLAVRPGPLAAKRHLLEMQVSTHQGKAEKAQQMLDALRMVPDRDPYEDGQALRVQVGSFTYVLLRARGLWYATGRDGRAPYKAGWAAVADWLVSNGVTQYAELVGASQVWLDGTPVQPEDPESLPVGASYTGWWGYADGPAVGDNQCPSGQPHGEHGWRNRATRSPVYHCRGVYNASRGDAPEPG